MSLAGGERTKNGTLGTANVKEGIGEEKGLPKDSEEVAQEVEVKGGAQKSLSSLQYPVLMLGFWISGWWMNGCRDWWGSCRAYVSI